MPRNKIFVLSSFDENNTNLHRKQQVESRIKDEYSELETAESRVKDISARSSDLNRIDRKFEHLIQLDELKRENSGFESPQDNSKSKLTFRKFGNLSDRAIYGSSKRKTSAKENEGFNNLPDAVKCQTKTSKDVLQVDYGKIDAEKNLNIGKIRPYQFSQLKQPRSNRIEDSIPYNTELTSDNDSA